jgi:hypothetical protein
MRGLTMLFKSIQGDRLPLHSEVNLQDLGPSDGIGGNQEARWDAPRAFRNYARSLQLSLFAFVFYIIGLSVLAFVALHTLALNRRGVVLPGWHGIASVLGYSIILMGMLMSWFGRSKSLEFRLPLSWRWLLDLSLWSESIGIIVRIAGRQVVGAPLARLGVLPLQIISWFAFWIFLHKLCRLMDRPRLERLSLLNLIAWITVLIFAVPILIHRWNPAWIPLLWFRLSATIAVLGIGIGIVANIRLLWRLSAELKAYAADLEDYVRETSATSGANLSREDRQ